MIRPRSRSPSSASLPARPSAHTGDRPLAGPRPGPVPVPGARRRRWRWRALPCGTGTRLPGPRRQGLSSCRYGYAPGGHRSSRHDATDKNSQPDQGAIEQRWRAISAHAEIDYPSFASALSSLGCSLASPGLRNLARCVWRDARLHAVAGG